jgi:hypothetical protein
LAVNKTSLAILGTKKNRQQIVENNLRGLKATYFSKIGIERGL